MKQYLDLLADVLHNGVDKDDRTGTGTLTLFCREMRFKMSDGFPLITTKRVHTRSVIYELLWFLRGDKNIKYLQENKVTIWNEWARFDGNVGPIYGSQWRNWGGGGIDQIRVLVDELKQNPNSRRLLVSAWNVSDLADMALPPCHFAFQCQVMNGNLNMKVFMRSLDIFLGAPFDIASYAYLLLLLSHQSGLVPGELIISATDVHLYKNHIKQAKLQLSRAPFPLPIWSINFQVPPSIDSYTYADLDSLVGNYIYHPAIPAPIAV